MKNIYNFLRVIKRCFDWMALPDSVSILKSQQEKVRHQIYAIVGRNKVILDVGSGNRPASSFNKVIKMDINSDCAVDILGDAYHIPFNKEIFDIVWLGGVLEHIEDADAVIKEIYRVLKKGGYIYIEIPFMQRIHGAPCDFQRFTIDGLRKLCGDFFKIEDGIICGPSSTFSHILRSYIALCLSFNNKYIYDFFYYYILGWFVFPIKYLDIIFYKYKNADKISFAFYYLGKKT